jgi:ADP-ribosyl-[dinitrogen reductase] hydrolase
MLSRKTGAFLGLAIGDALGRPLHSLKDGFIRQAFGEIDGYADSISAFPDRPARWCIPGLYGSNTQQALLLAEAALVFGSADANSVAGLYLRLAKEGPTEGELGAWRNPTTALHKAIRAMEEGTLALHCGHSAPTPHPAARIAPLALLFDDEDALVRAVIETTLPTHNDPRSVAGALAIARAVSLFSSENPKPLELCSDIARWTRSGEERLYDEYREYLPETVGRDWTHQMSNILNLLPRLVEEKDDALAERTLVSAANSYDPPEPIARCSVGFAPSFVGMALYWALSSGSFPIAVLRTVEAGGETDAAGAIVGAVAGSRFGIDEIPEEWLNKLLNKQMLQVRARCLAEREVDWGAWDDLVEMECRLTQDELRTIDKTRGKNEKSIQKRESQVREKRAKAEANKPPEPSPFAPPPDVWLRHRDPQLPPLPRDPVEAKRERALRGRKRVAWKEVRREKSKLEDSEEET